MSAEAHAQSPIETNLQTTRRGIFDLLPLQKLSRISQQTASVITKERLHIKKISCLKMNAIQTAENSFLNSPTVFENVGPTILKCFSSTRACAWGVA